MFIVTLLLLASPIAIIIAILALPKRILKDYDAMVNSSHPGPHQLRRPGNRSVNVKDMMREFESADDGNREDHSKVPVEKVGA